MTEEERKRAFEIAVQTASAQYGMEFFLIGGITILPVGFNYTPPALGIQPIPGWTLPERKSIEDMRTEPLAIKPRRIRKK